MHISDSMDEHEPGLSSSPDSEGAHFQPATPTHSGEIENERPDKNDFAAVRAKRRAQNRLSQRAFRERRERHVKNLEHQFQDLLVKHQMLLKSFWVQKMELAQLRRTVDQLTGELEGMESASSSRPIDMPDRTGPTTTTAAAAATTTPSSLSSSSSSISSHRFDETDTSFKERSNEKNSNEIDGNANENIPFYPLDGGQLQPRSQSEDINVGILMPTDDAYAYMNSIADWSQRLDLGVSRDVDKQGPNLMTMSRSEPGLDPLSFDDTNMNADDIDYGNNGEVCFGWNYLDL